MNEKVEFSKHESARFNNECPHLVFSNEKYLLMKSKKYMSSHWNYHFLSINLITD